MTRDQIDMAILEAFADVPYPGDTNIAASKTVYGDDYEGQIVENFFRGRDWKTVSLEILWAELRSPPEAALVFMSAEAKLYYFPAFMRISLLGPTEADVVFDAPINHITPGLYGAGVDFISIFERYDDAKKRVIALWLRFLSGFAGADFEEGGPALALGRYWSRYDQTSAQTARAQR
jgi:hypothetical protein